MTGVCIRCGWIVLDRERCPRDSALAVSWKTAAAACGVSTLRGVLNLSPAARVHAFTMARARRASRRLRVAIDEEVRVER